MKKKNQKKMNVKMMRLMMITKEIDKKNKEKLKFFNRYAKIWYKKGYYDAIDMINRTALIEDKSDLESHERHVKK